jgi:hypothetical protein
MEGRSQSFSETCQKGFWPRGALARSAISVIEKNTAPVSPALVWAQADTLSVDLFFQDSRLVSAGLRPAGSALLNGRTQSISECDLLNGRTQSISECDLLGRRTQSISECDLLGRRTQQQHVS